ncbi:MAG: helix-turn-helix domain-containing protein [SAR202 cluster bacterium]|jgi:excisionase family DNA binding protein|nr:helix-turn-helix domain-containing protein [SAR202 cluster bacterium]
MENRQALTMSVSEAGVLLGIGRNLAYRLAREGSLPGVRRLGTRYIVSRMELNTFLTNVSEEHY